MPFSLHKSTGMSSAPEASILGCETQGKNLAQALSPGKAMSFFHPTTQQKSELPGGLHSCKNSSSRKAEPIPLVFAKLGMGGLGVRGASRVVLPGGSNAPPFPAVTAPAPGPGGGDGHLLRTQQPTKSAVSPEP